MTSVNWDEVEKLWMSVGDFAYLKEAYDSGDEEKIAQAFAICVRYGENDAENWPLPKAALTRYADRLREVVREGIDRSNGDFEVAEIYLRRLGPLDKLPPDYLLWLADRALLDMEARTWAPILVRAARYFAKIGNVPKLWETVLKAVEWRNEDLQEIVVILAQAEGKLVPESVLTGLMSTMDEAFQALDESEAP